MDLMYKLSVLGEAARYDVSCSSSGSSGIPLSKSDSSNVKSIGNTAIGGICHTWTEDGRCVSLLKVLLTNHCDYNCAYCINRKDNDIRRAAFTPRELASLTIEFYKRNYIEGLFLSSGVVKSPDHTMGLLIETISILRNEYCFGGYIHVKTIPGASSQAVYELGLLTDRISVNVEFCSSDAFTLLAPQKNIHDIISPITLIRDKCNELSDCRKNHIKTPVFVPGGQSTQVIVGATKETDYSILRMSQGLYNNYKLKRVYYSAYIPVNSHKNLPAITGAPPLLREHRLYQADWLLRFYSFDAREILSPDLPDLDLQLDPKCSWAVRNFDSFPVEINRADYQMLLRVPGIGVLSARKIIAARKSKSLSFEDARKLGVVLKRAVFFLTFNGKYETSSSFTIDQLKYSLADNRGKQIFSMLQMRIEDLLTVAGN